MTASTAIFLLLLSGLGPAPNPAYGDPLPPSEVVDLNLEKDDRAEAAEAGFAEAQARLQQARSQAAQRVQDAKQAYLADRENEAKRAALADAMSLGLKADAESTADVAEAAGNLFEAYSEMQRQVREAATRAHERNRVKQAKRQETERKLENLDREIVDLHRTHKEILEDGELPPEARAKMERLLLANETLERAAVLAQSVEKAHRDAANRYQEEAGRIEEAVHALGLVHEKARNQTILLAEFAQDFGEILSNVKWFGQLRRMMQNIAPQGPEWTTLDFGFDSLLLTEPGGEDDDARMAPQSESGRLSPGYRQQLDKILGRNRPSGDGPPEPMPAKESETQERKSR